MGPLDRIFKFRREFLQHSASNPSLQIRRVTCVECVIEGVCLGSFDVNVRIVELVFTVEQHRQVVKIPIVQRERGRDLNGSLVLVNRLLLLSFGFMYLAKGSMRL